MRLEVLELQKYQLSIEKFALFGLFWRKKPWKRQFFLALTFFGQKLAQSRFELKRQKLTDYVSWLLRCGRLIQSLCRCQKIFAKIEKEKHRRKILFTRLAKSKRYVENEVCSRWSLFSSESYWLNLLGLHCDHLSHEEKEYKKTNWLAMLVQQFYVRTSRWPIENNRNIRNIIWRDEHLQEETEVIDKLSPNFQQKYIHTWAKNLNKLHKVFRRALPEKLLKSLTN